VNILQICFTSAVRFLHKDFDIDRTVLFAQHLHLAIFDCPSSSGPANFDVMLHLGTEWPSNQNILIADTILAEPGP